jgi:GNAT superfamily N-acetyltransferase
MPSAKVRMKVNESLGCVSGWRRCRLGNTPRSWPMGGARRLPGLRAHGANAERLHPHERHWNLKTMGIVPAAQGHGLGSRLIAPRAGPASPGCPAASTEGQALSCWTASNVSAPSWPSDTPPL